MKVLEGTEIIHLINMTDQPVFVTISGDSNTNRGIILKPGRLSFCICQFQRRRRATRSRHQLTIDVISTPAYDQNNIRIIRTVNVWDDEEIYKISLKNVVPSLLRLTASVFDETPPPDIIFPYNSKDWIFNHYTNLPLEYWECNTQHKAYVNHNWIRLYSCSCEEDLRDTHSDLFEIVNEFDYPHEDECVEFIQEAYRVYRERALSYLSNIARRRIAFRR